MVPPLGIRQPRPDSEALGLSLALIRCAMRLQVLCCLNRVFGADEGDGNVNEPPSRAPDVIRVLPTDTIDTE